MTTYTLESSREWYNNLPGKRASAAMIIKRGEEYLMIKDDYKDAMTFPTGVIDADESAKSAAIRETKEEVGIICPSDNVTFYSVAYISEQYGFKDRFHFYFFIENNQIDDDQITLSKGIEYYKWVPMNEIAINAGDRRAYIKLQTMLELGSREPYFEV